MRRAKEKWRKDPRKREKCKLRTIFFLFFFLLLKKIFLKFNGGHIVAICLNLEVSIGYFPEWLVHFTFPLTKYECSHFSASLSTRLLSVFLIIGFVMGVKLYLIVVLIYIILTNVHEQLFIYYWPLVYLLWRSLSLNSYAFFAYIIYYLYFYCWTVSFKIPL